MTRMVQAAAAAVIIVLLVALVCGPLDEPPAPALLNANGSDPVQSRPDPEVSFILEARKELGSVLQGTSLDAETAAGDFAESLEQLRRP